MQNTHRPRPYRRLVPQVLRPRLRPCWRIARKLSVTLASLAFVGWTGRALGTAALGTAVAEHDWKEIRAQADRMIAEENLKMELERDQALRAASNSAYAPGDEQLCELLYGREVAVCDREALKRLAEEKAHGQRKPSPARPSRSVALQPADRAPAVVGPASVRSPRSPRSPR